MLLALTLSVVPTPTWQNSTPKPKSLHVSFNILSGRLTWLYQSIPCVFLIFADTQLCSKCYGATDKKVGLGVGKAIQQARADKKMTQAALAKIINEKPAVINQYENGKAIPNGQVRYQPYLLPSQ